MAKYQKVPISELFVDSRYQQDLSQRRVEKMTAEFDERKLGVLEVSRRTTGRKAGMCATFDGQHRLAMLIGVGAKEAPCLVHEGLTPQEEAELFYEIQENRRRPTPVAAYRARKFAGEPIAVAIGDVLKKYGVEVGIGYGPGDVPMLASVTTAERIYFAGNLEETISLLADMWITERKVWDKNLMEGMSYFLALYGARLERAELLRAFEDESPTTIIRKAIAASITSGGAKRDLVTEELRKLAAPAAKGVLRRPPREDQQIAVRYLTIVRECVGNGPRGGMAQAEIAVKTGLPTRDAGRALRILATVGVLKRAGSKKIQGAGKEGSIVYRLAPAVVRTDSAAA